MHSCDSSLRDRDGIVRAAATGISRRSFSSFSWDLRHVFTYVKVENGPSFQCRSTHNRVAMAICPWILFIPLQAMVILGTLTPGAQARHSFPATSAAIPRCSWGRPSWAEPQGQALLPWTAVPKGASAPLRALPPPRQPVALWVLSVVKGGCSLNTG